MAVRSASRVSTFREFVSALRLAMRPGGPSMPDRVRAVPRLVRASARGEYPSTSMSRLLLMAAVTGYIVSPVDLLPEGLLSIFGLADDAVLMAWLAAQLVAETEEFILWEYAQATAGTGPGARADGARRGRGGSAGGGTASGQTVPGHVVG